MLADDAAYYSHFRNRLLPFDIVHSVILVVDVCAHGVDDLWMGAVAGRSPDPGCCPTLHHLYPAS